MLSPAVEDYLKAIFTLQTESGEDGPVGTSRLAEHMNVSSASVTNMLKRLDTLSLATYTAYKGVRLSEAGRTIALEIIRHHRLLETYLRDVMGYDWEEMHAEAERLEHHISEEFEDRLDHMLGYPTHDPHGDPIPDRDGTMVEIASEPLSSCPFDTPLVVRRVTDTDVEVLRAIELLNLLPGQEVTILGDGHHAHPSEGTMETGGEYPGESGAVITVRHGPRILSVPEDLAQHVFASPRADHPAT